MSAAVNDGGPAFPVSEENGHGSLILTSEGMTLRDYFIAHAPAEPQSWFEPAIGQRPKAPEYPSRRTEEENSELDGLGDWLDICDLKQPRVKAYAVAKKAYDVELSTWNKTRERERYVQWPAAWADATLKARES